MDQHLDGDARKAFFAGKPHSSQAEQHPQSQTPDLEGIPAHTMGPGDVPAEKRRHHHRHKHSKPNNQDSDDEDRPIIPPAELVQMILGEDENDNTRGVRPIFSEMEVLHRFDDFFEWREQARWIKFEEDVEEGGVRWSKPHVASLSLHSLFELRSMLLNGAVLLDLDASTLDHVVDLVLDHLPTLTPAVKEKVRVILLQRHRHLYERGKEGVMCQLPRPERHSTRRLSSPRRTPADGLEYRRNSVYNSKHQIIKHKGNMDFMRKIPAGAEASNILVGEVDFLDKPVSAFVRLRTATLFGDLTEVPVPTRFIFILLAPTGGAINVTEVGRTMGTLMADEVFAAVAYRARAPQHLLAAADEFMGSATVLPPGEWDPDIRIEPPDAVPSQEPRKRPESMLEYVDPEIQEQKMREESGLTRSGRLFGGMINDLKRKAPWFWSDFKDALAMQCVASWIFLYFACLSPIITFGGLLSEATGRNMAAMESLVSGFACGVIYGFFSGQPLAILGSTGPVLVFEAIIYDVSISMGLDYMTFRLWIGLWMAFILFVMVATDAGSFVCYITRFTEENFATLIALIFVYKAIENVMKLSKKFPLDTHQSSLGHCVCKLPPLLPPIDGFNWTTLDPHSCQSLNGSLVGDGCDAATKHVPDVFLMSVILFFGTFTISIILKDFKNSLFFTTKVRQFLSDFAVIIAIVIMSFIDYTVNIPTPKLEVPSEFKPTLAERGWLIPFSNNPLWTIPLAFLPAIIGTILIFMDQQITVVIVNRKDNKLKKGCGYHLDLFVLSILIALCSVMGLPWFVASTVQSINHVDSLKIESECAAPGDKPQFLGVREQRVTHILIFLMIGLSVLITPILSHIPMPVLFGVFLYMGVASLKGLQFFDRILLMFMPTKYQPDFAFLRKVPIRRVHLFTMIQLLCFILLWLINSYSQTSILFPIMLVVLVGVRKCLDFIFTQRELKALDDIMPSSKKRKHHGKDAESGFKEDNLKIPLTNGNLKIVIKPMNVSEEVTKTGIWKQVNNDKNNSLNTRKKTILKDSSTTEDNDRNGAVPAHQSQPPLKRGKT